MSFVPKFQLEVAAKIDSTNAALMGREGAIHGLALLAREQTSGHGRRGRSWDFSPGNLALSLGFEVMPAQSELVPRLSFLAGVALFDSVRALYPKAKALSLKWPNDLLLGTNKVAGLLMEARQSESRLRVVLGVGVNLVAAPANMHATSLLEETGLKYDPQAFAQDFLQRFTNLGSMLPDFSMLRSAWEERALHMGQEIFYGDRDQPNSMRKAVALRLLDSGALCVKDLLDGEERALLSEDTSLRI